MNKKFLSTSFRLRLSTAAFGWFKIGFHKSVRASIMNAPWYLCRSAPLPQKTSSTTQRIPPCNDVASSKKAIDDCSFCVFIIHSHFDILILFLFVYLFLIYLEFIRRPYFGPLATDRRADHRTTGPAGRRSMFA